jgi:homogentisate solanesyltransferase
VLEGAGGALGGSGKKGGLQERLGAFYRFTRPHTIRGTILASAMGVLRCLIENPKAFTLQPIPRALLVRGVIEFMARERPC